MRHILTSLLHILRLFCCYGLFFCLTQAAQQDADEGVEKDEESAEKSEDEDKPVVETRAAKGSKKGKRGKGKGGRDDPGDDDGGVLDPLAHVKGEVDPDNEKKKPLTKKEKRRLEEEQRRREVEVSQRFLSVQEVMSTHELIEIFSGA